MRRIGFLDTLAADDPETSIRYGAFLQGLQGIGRAVAATFGLPLRRCRSHSSQRRQDDYGSAKQGERNTDHLCERRPLTSPRGLGVGVLPR